jgi:hypothetical protein
MGQWAERLGQAARSRFGCRYYKGKYHVPSMSVIRDCLLRVEPDDLDRALSTWALEHIDKNEPLAFDGKTMKGAVDEEGAKTHIVSLIGQSSGQCIAITGVSKAYTTSSTGTMMRTEAASEQDTDPQTLLACVDLLSECSSRSKNPKKASRR